jgi:hypothetical protein
MGDEAFETAFDRLPPRAVATAERLLGDRSAAVAALARAYAAWDELHRLPYLDVWVLCGTANVAYDQDRPRRVSSSM